MSSAHELSCNDLNTCECYGQKASKTRSLCQQMLALVNAAHTTLQPVELLACTSSSPLIISTADGVNTDS
jgi:hypothetical protein